MYVFEGIEGFHRECNNPKWRLTCCDTLNGYTYYVVFDNKVFIMGEPKKEIVNNMEEYVTYCKFHRDLTPMELMLEAIKIGDWIETFWR